MPAYVRVRKHDDFVAAVDATGTQTDISALAGISLSRLSQLYTGRHDVIEVSKAGSLEDVLGVARGALFKFTEDYDRLAPYVDTDDDGDGPEPEDVLPTNQSGDGDDVSDGPATIERPDTVMSPEMARALLIASVGRPVTSSSQAA